jgi:hypothetical protein
VGHTSTICGSQRIRPAAPSFAWQELADGEDGSAADAAALPVETVKGLVDAMQSRHAPLHNALHVRQLRQTITGVLTRCL